jgi:hypothetical protein
VDSSSINLDDQLPEAPVILDDTGDYHEETTKPLHDCPIQSFRSVPDTTLSKLKSQKEFEYANDPEYWIKKKKREKSNKGIGYFIEWVFGSSAVRIIMYIFIGLIILYTYTVSLKTIIYFTTLPKEQSAAYRKTPLKWRTRILMKKSEGNCRQRSSQGSTVFVF